MKLTILLLIMLSVGFGFWKYNENQKTTTPPSLTHTVQKGDTLTRIAANNNTTVQSIQKQNNLKSTNIYPGQKLTIIPGEQTKGEIAQNKPTKSKTTSPTKKSPPKTKITASTPSKKTPPKAQIVATPTKTKTTPKKSLPKTAVMESRHIAIDIDDKNQVYLKDNQGKFTPSGTIIYGSEPDAEGREVKIITYKDRKGKKTTLRGSATPEDVIRLALQK